MVQIELLIHNNIKQDRINVIKESIREFMKKNLTARTCAYAERNIAFTSPIFSVLDDLPSTICYILIPTNDDPNRSGRPPAILTSETDCSLVARSMFKGFWVQICPTRHNWAKICLVKIQFRGMRQFMSVQTR